MPRRVFGRACNDDRGALPIFVRKHLFDILAMPALLSVATLLTMAPPISSAFFARPAWAFALCAAAIAEWEWVAPLHSSATADWRDVPAYLAGAACYLLIREGAEHRRKSRIAPWSRLAHFGRRASVGIPSPRADGGMAPLASSTSISSGLTPAKIMNSLMRWC
jgi:hypothetical protein